MSRVAGPGPAHETSQDPVTDGARPAPRAMALVAAAMIAVLLVATAAGFRFLDPDALPRAAVDPVITMDPGHDLPAGQVAGTLRLNGDCLLVGEDVVVFAAGATWSEPDRAVVLPGGRPWRVGERMEVYGGDYSVGSVPAVYGEQPVAAAAQCATELGVDRVVLVGP